MMGSVHDIAGYSKDGSLQLVVEVTRAPKPTAAWASMMRRNLLAHGLVSRAPFFLLALPTRLYLWKDESEPAAPPQYEAEMKPLADWLWNRHPGRPAPTSEYALEVLLSSWFTHVLNDRLQKPLGPEFAWFVESGLSDALHSGRIVSKAAA